MDNTRGLCPPPAGRSMPIPLAPRSCRGLFTLWSPKDGSGILEVCLSSLDGQIQGVRSSQLENNKAKALIPSNLTTVAGQSLITLFDPRMYRLHTWFFDYFIPEETPRLEYPYILMPPSSGMPSFQISPPMGPQPKGGPRFRDMIPMAIAGTVAITLGALLEKVFKSPNKAQAIPVPPLLAAPLVFPNTPYYASPYPSHSNLAVRSSSAQDLSTAPSHVATRFSPNSSSKFARHSPSRPSHPRVQELPDDFNEEYGRNGARSKSTPDATTLGDHSQPAHSESSSRANPSPEHEEGASDKRPVTVPAAKEPQLPKARTLRSRLEVKNGSLLTKPQIKDSNGFAEELLAKDKILSDDSSTAPPESIKSEISITELLKPKPADQDRPLMAPYDRLLFGLGGEYKSKRPRSKHRKTPSGAKVQDIVQEPVPETTAKLSDNGGLPHSTKAVIADSQNSAAKARPLTDLLGFSQPDSALLLKPLLSPDVGLLLRGFQQKDLRRLRSSNGLAARKPYSPIEFPEIMSSRFQPRMARFTALARPFLLDANTMEIAQEETEK
ncbi:MAG: hypothetical protein Q9220_002892 [cf. Caloplaca sp. 1 TL-2023]